MAPELVLPGGAEDRDDQTGKFGPAHADTYRQIGQGIALQEFVCGSSCRCTRTLVYKRPVSTRRARSNGMPGKRHFVHRLKYHRNIRSCNQQRNSVHSVKKYPACIALRMTFGPVTMETFGPVYVDSRVGADAILILICLTRELQ